MRAGLDENRDGQSIGAPAMTEAHNHGVDALNSPLTLPCGAIIRNRLVKAAMTEGLADPMNRVTAGLDLLYRRWACNGLGLMITGNIQIDRRHLERPGNIAIDDNGGIEELSRLALTGTSDGAHFWAQINHPGRQTPASINATPLAPSAISLPLALAGCGEARAMTEHEVEDAIDRFVATAAVCKQAGFTGVQIHAAHGYLISQFLSPLSNKRQDRWGGSLENRARFLLETVRQVRAEVGGNFPISVKLNSADFQRGGFNEDESGIVAGWLDSAGVDLLEVSGGTYEQMQMVGLGEDNPRVAAASTLAREAYFLEYAASIRSIFKGPIMITGGLRHRSSMNEALGTQACEFIGIGRPMCVYPDDAGKLLQGADALQSPDAMLVMDRDVLGPDVDDATFKSVESFAVLGWYCNQIARIGQGRDPDPQMGVYDALIAYKQSEEAATQRWCRPA